VSELIQDYSPNPNPQDEKVRELSAYTYRELQEVKNTLDHLVLELQDKMVVWVSPYVPGARYNKNDMVLDGVWTMIANKETTDRAAPQPDGAEDWLLPDSPAWVSQSFTEENVSATQVTGTLDSYLLTGIRVWIPDLSATMQYTLTARNNITGVFESTNIFTGSDISQVGWAELFVADRFFDAGVDISFQLKTKDITTIDARPSLDYVYTDRDQDPPLTDPGSGNTNYNRNSIDLRISETDRNSISQATELNTVKAGSTIKVVETADANRSVEFQVNTITQPGGYRVYQSILIAEGAAGRPRNTQDVNVNITNYGAAPSPYVELVNLWTPYSGIQGHLKLGSGAEIISQTAYGVDLLVTPMSFSPDWDIVAYSG